MDVQCIWNFLIERCFNWALIGFKLNSLLNNITTTVGIYPIEDVLFVVCQNYTRALKLLENKNFIGLLFSMIYYLMKYFFNFFFSMNFFCSKYFLLNYFQKENCI